jgi:hypothetical protein
MTKQPTILAVTDNIDAYSQIAERLAGNNDYALGSDGEIEIDFKANLRIGLDANGNLYRGRYFNCQLKWEPVTFAQCYRIVNRLRG